MDTLFTKETAEKFMKIRGEVRGLALRSHGEFILKERGPEGLELVEKIMKESGYPIDHKSLGAMKFYPVGLELIELLAIKKAFDFNDEKFIEMGVFSSKNSLIMRLFMKYFVSIDIMTKQASRIWKKYYTIGDLKAIELNKDKRYLILRLKDFNIHPLHCLHVGGYLSSVVKMVVKKQVSCEEVKCIYRGDDCHEFLLRW